MLANLGEAVGGFAVVITLLYLAYELRTNTKTMRAVAASQSQESLAEFNSLMATSPDLVGPWASANEAGTLQSLPTDQQVQVTLMLRSIMQRFESIYFQYEAKILDERNWQVRKHWLAGWLSNPVVAEWWRTERESSFFTDDFIQQVESVSVEDSFGATGAING